MQTSLVTEPVPKPVTESVTEPVTESVTEPVTESVTFKNYNFKTDYPELESLYDFSSKTLTSNKNKINFVVTHGNCSDGFMSSTIVRMWLKNNNVDLDKVTFYNAYYGSDLSKLPEMMQGKYVVICDFSFTKELFDKMVKSTNNNILILDHHKTAQSNLKDVSPNYLTFDMKHSGAFITWTYFFGFMNIPKAVLYVEDHDIWTKCLPQTDEFSAYLFAQKFDFNEYEKVFQDKYLVEHVFPSGAGMVQRNNDLIDQLTKKTSIAFVEIKGRYYFVACINSAGVLRSEIGNNVLKVFNNANFSMVYSHDPFNGSTIISYRSLDDRSDSTEISKLNGGGGHRNASGAMIGYYVSNPPGRVIDPYRLYNVLNNLYTVKKDEKTFLVLNNATANKHIVKYLMQERYINDDGLVKNKQRTDKGLIGYQEGLFCMRNRTNNQDLDTVYSGAIAWFYDAFEKRYKLTANFLPNVLNINALINDANKYTVLRIEDEDGPPYVNCRYEFTDLKNNSFEISYTGYYYNNIDEFLDRFIF